MTPINDITNIPAPRVNFIDPRTGLMAREWYRFFLNLFQLTGNGTNAVSLTDLQVGPPVYDVSGDIENAGINAQLSYLSTAVDALQDNVNPSQTDVSSQLDVLRSGIESLAVQPPVAEAQQLHYGAFQDNTTQTAAAINTAYAITFDTTDFAFGVSRGTTTSQIYVWNPGVYNIQFSMQMTKTGGASVKYAYIWFRLNGTDIPDSATRIALGTSNADLVAAWNFVTRMAAGDYIELMWAVEDTAIQVVHYSAVAFAPGIPSAILTITQCDIAPGR